MDISDYAIKPPRHERRIRQWYYFKYLLLILIFVGAVFSFQFIFFLDPLIIITRSTTIAILPIAYYLAEGLFSNLALSPILGEYFFDIYAGLKGTILPVQEQLFRQNLPILLFFIVIIVLEKLNRRFWCRYLCPLGALLGLVSRYSLFGRYVGEECSDCMICSRECKMGTIKEEMDSSRAECILCLNCYFSCPEGDIHYGFKRLDLHKSPIEISRRRFLGAIGSGLVLMGLYRTSPLNINRSEKAIRPPGAVAEDRFLDLCLRCQQCTSICATTGKCLQPSVSEAGLEGLWTPVADMRGGYCEYNCNLCGQVCPSGAIQSLSLEEKKRFVMGLAFFDVNRCIPYYKGENCLVCEEHCPTPDKAIKFNEVLVVKEGQEKRVKLPYVDENLCIGCGICENKCPIVGRSGIFITRYKPQKS